MRTLKQRQESTFLPQAWQKVVSLTRQVGKTDGKAPRQEMAAGLCKTALPRLTKEKKLISVPLTTETTEFSYPAAVLQMQQASP